MKEIPQESLNNQPALNTIPTEETLKAKPPVEDLRIEEQKHVEKIYNDFYLMQKLKDGILPIVQKLREDIEKGTYNTLISDEGAGRIPTLVFREILRKKGPENNQLKTIFLAFGRGKHWDLSLIDYVRKHKDEWGKALVVTEYSGTGKTINNIHEVFEKDAGFVTYDIACLFQHKHEEYMGKLPLWSTKDPYIIKKYHGFFVGERGEETNGGLLSLTLRKPSGVGKRKIDSLISGQYIIGAFPEKLSELEENSEPTGVSSIDGLLKPMSPEEIEARGDPKKEKELLQVLRNKEPKKVLSLEEKLLIQESVNKAREDVKTLAQEIIDDVWGKE